MSSPSQIRARKFAAAAGKANFELSCCTSGKSQNKNSIVFITSREEIESCDITRFLGTFSPKQLDHHLQELRGNVRFTVAGYDDEPEPLFAIAEVRQFYSLCHSRWPCWTFFADLRSDCLATVAACVAPNLVSVKRPRRKVDVFMRQPELISFFEHCLPAAAYLHSRVKIDKFTGAKLLQRVSDYLQIPD